jgi:hypothetical protein
MQGTIVWNMRVTLDRQVAAPGETLYAQFTLANALAEPMFIESITWNTNFYPVDQAVRQEVKKIIPPHGQEYLAAGTIRIPDVPSDQYRIDVVARTLIYHGGDWVDLQIVPLTEGKTFLVAHTPRFRAFVSRSLRAEDLPVADAMLPVIQSWGFDTHTVGINEFESDPAKLSERVLAEVVKADCLFAVATPRDISQLDHLVRAFAWLNSEASFAFAVKKPLLLLVDQSVKLEGLLATPHLAPIRYDPANLPVFLGLLNVMMPFVRQAVAHHVQTQAIVQRAQAERVVAYGAFIAGTIQRKLPE